jgi:hypothetical protein
MLRNVGKCFVEEVGPGLHHRLKLVLGLSCGFPGILKVLLGAAKFVLNAFESLHRTGIWCHLVEIVIENADFFKQLFLELVVSLLVKMISIRKTIM